MTVCVSCSIYLCERLSNFSHPSLNCLSLKLLKKTPVDWWLPMKWKTCTLCFHGNIKCFVCFCGCSTALWLISSFGTLQGDKSTFDMLDTEGRAHMHAHLHNRRWRMAGGPHPRNEERDVQQRGNASNGELWEDSSLSTRHPTDLILLCKATVVLLFYLYLPLCMSSVHGYYRWNMVFVD